jgi:structural maintenance of chromosomes protein 5
VPVFEKEIDNVTDELKHMFNNYYVGGYSFNSKKSKYSSETSIGSYDISASKVRRLGVSQDQSSIDDLQAEITAKEKSVASHEAHKHQAVKEKEKLLAELKQISDAYKEQEKRKKDLKNKENEIEIKQDLLKNAGEPKTNVEVEKNKFKTEKVGLVKELCKQVEGNLDLISSCGQLDLLRCAHQLQLQNVEGEHQDSNHQANELEREYAEVCAHHAETSAKYAIKREEILDIHTMAHKATGGVHDQTKKYLPPPPWQAKFDAISNTLKSNIDERVDVNVWQAFIEDCEEQIKRYGVKPDLKKKIEEEKISLEKAREDLHTLEAQKASKLTELVRLRQGWINDVKRLVDRVDHKFAGMMSKLDYSGRVELQEGVSDALDMKNYGIKIMVKFR